MSIDLLPSVLRFLEQGSHHRPEMPTAAPAFAPPIYANLFNDEDSEGSSLIRSCPNTRAVTDRQSKDPGRKTGVERRQIKTRRSAKPERASRSARKICDQPEICARACSNTSRKAACSLAKP